jgi:hypothetical protein
MRQLIAAGVLALAAQALFAASSQAGILTTSATGCDDQVLEQPFTRWLDPASYVLAPAGTFEQGVSSWALAGGASVVDGNEPYFVHGSGESSSLSLGGGGSATSDAMCVGIEHPTLRLFARNRGGLLSTLKVEVLFEDAAGDVHSLPISLLTASSQWRPTVAMPIVANLLPLLPGEHTAVAFRFTSSNAGNWQIDDVYVDPYRSR